MKTGGPVRGFISRWLVRFEASQQVLQAGFLGITAASTLTSALIGLGFERFAPYVLGLGCVLTPAFAYGYVESGVFNRKNRERMDRGDNFAGPGMYMNHVIQARSVAAALANADDPEAAMDAAEGVARESVMEFRDGVDLDVFYPAEENGRGRQEVEA